MPAGVTEGRTPTLEGAEGAGWGCCEEEGEEEDDEEGGEEEDDDGPDEEEEEEEERDGEGRGELETDAREPADAVDRAGDAEAALLRGGKVPI